MAHVENYKKRNKKSFLQKARRHGKQGNYGMGKRLSEEEYNYFIRIFEQLKQVDGEDKEILVNGFFRELLKDGNEERLSSNQIVSRILDEVLPLASVSNIVSLTDALSYDLRVLCLDSYASHVIQTLLGVCLQLLQPETEKAKSSSVEDQTLDEKHLTEIDREKVTIFLVKVSKFIFNNLEEFVGNTYASHIVRSVLEVCSGVRLDESVRCGVRSQTKHNVGDGKVILTTPAELQELLQKICCRLLQLPRLPEILCYESGSAIFQSSLLVLNGLGKLGEVCLPHLVDHILTHGFGELSITFGVISDVVAVFQNDALTRLLEVVLTVSTIKQQQRIFNDYFRGHLEQLVRHQLANFVVQRLLETWKDKEEFEELYEEMSSCLNIAMEVNHCGVVRSFVRSCLRLETKQSSCLQTVMILFDCHAPDTRQQLLPILLLRFLSYDQFLLKKQEESLPPISLHGALVLQDLLHFNKPIKIVNGILNMNVSDLQKMACDPRGSFVIDAFVFSSSVGEKSREKLAHKLKGSMTSLACSKHGSRSLESVWKVASVKIRTSVCNELIRDELKLKENKFGIIVYNNFKVGMFKRSDKSDWNELQNQDDKKRKMLNELLSEVSSVETAQVPGHHHKKQKKSSKQNDS